MLLDNLFTVRAAVGLTLVLAAVAVLAALPSFRRMKHRTLFAVAAVLLTFQVFHLIEHLIQFGYWFAHPNARPYMTPWAVEGVDGLALWAGEIPGQGPPRLRGMELLHLIGNFLFLGGLLALNRLRTTELPGLKLATRIQAVHVAEHVLLTTTVFAMGSPLGLSTLFGLSEGTAWGGTVRVWFHFMINLAATIPAVIAWRRYLSDRRDQPGSRSASVNREAREPSRI